jgi:hypothetical protein
MKKCLLLIFLMANLSIYGQEKLLGILPTENGSVIYTGLIKVDSIDKNALYGRAKKWFIDNYKSAKDVIQLDDKENGEITGKGNFKINYYARDARISHTISILVKDGRCKYIITDFSYSDSQNDKFAIENFPKTWAGKKKLYIKVDEEVKSIIVSIEKFMATKPKNDW